MQRVMERVHVKWIALLAIVAIMCSCAGVASMAVPSADAAQLTSLSSAKITFSGDVNGGGNTAYRWRYTGQEVTPTFTVTINGVQLDEGDYTWDGVCYSDNACTQPAEPVERGWYVIKITGNEANGYKGFKKAAFQIQRGNLFKSSAEKIAVKYYDGCSGYTPTTTIANTVGTELVEGEDYKLVGYYKGTTLSDAKWVSDCTQVSNYWVKYEGINNYIGTKTVWFQIVRMPLSKVTAQDIATAGYDGSAYQPTPVLTNPQSGKGLKVGTDFTCAYYSDAACTDEISGGILEGTYYVKCTGKGNYTGTIVLPFEVAAPQGVEMTVDSVEALRAALLEARDSASIFRPYTITLAEGTYSVTTKLHIFSHTTLVATGCTLVNETDDTGLIETAYISSESYSGYEAAEDITILGGTWDNNWYEKGCARFVHSQGITINGATFKNSTNAHLMEFTSCKDVEVKWCTFSGFEGTTTAAVEALQIDINNENHSTSSYYDDTPNCDFKIHHNTFKDFQAGVGTHSAIRGTYFDNISITWNKFENINRHAISAVNYTNSTIKNNTIVDCGAGIYFGNITKSHDNLYEPAYADNCSMKISSWSTIANNTITIANTSNYSKMSTGIELYGEKVKTSDDGVVAGDYRLARMTVSNNTITLEDSGYGIMATGLVNSTIKGNNITIATPSDGDGKGVCDGIRLDVGSSSNTVSSNKINITTNNDNDASASGIVVQESSKKNTLSGNTITSANKDGITVRSNSSAIITGNVVGSYGNCGIRVYGSDCKAYVSGNDVSGDSAIKFTGGATQVSSPSAV